MHLYLVTCNINFPCMFLNTNFKKRLHEVGRMNYDEFIFADLRGTKNGTFLIRWPMVSFIEQKFVCWR
jgi:hypothetical protein